MADPKRYRRPRATAATRLRLVFACAALLGMTSSNVPAGEAIHTSKPKFRIPFQLDADEIARLGAVKIQLYVSHDAGRRWQALQTVSPDAGRFVFEAEEDGEYWFGVRTRDSRGGLHPAGPLRPGLQVVIDRSAPKVDLRVSEAAAGTVQLIWKFTDDHLDLDTLELQYRDEATNEWTDVSITPTAGGKTSWSVPGGGEVEVRATVADRAGNTGQQRDSAILTAARSPFRSSSPPEQKPDFSQPIAAAAAPPVVDDPPQLTLEAAPAPLATPVSRPGRADPIIRPSLARGQREADPELKRIRARSFSINYEVSDVGPSGIGSVELYITEDGGRRWFHYGNDADQRSPFNVTVPRDGRYGFAIRVRSGAGLADPVPQPGDSPEIKLLVDATSPEVVLEDISAGEGQAHNRITFRWTARDHELLERPVQLLYGSSPGGPWQAVTEPVQNTGQYTWEVSPSVPQPLYLKLVVEDLAGNRTQVVKPEPITLDFARPSARITEIAPTGDPF